MPKIEQTIETLLADVKPVKPMLRPWVSFLLWAGITLAATLLLACFSSLRADIYQQLPEPLFLTEITSLTLTIAASGLVAVWLCFPDLQQKPRIVYLPLVPLAIYVACLAYRAFNPDMDSVLPEDADNGMNCVLCITMYSLVPGFWMFRTLRCHATTRPALAGAVSLLASASIGLLVLKFLEGNDSLMHLLQWHLIPVMLFGVFGTFIGKKFLRW